MADLCVARAWRPPRSAVAGHARNPRRVAPYSPPAVASLEIRASPSTCVSAACRWFAESRRAAPPRGCRACCVVSLRMLSSIALRPTPAARVSAISCLSLAEYAFKAVKAAGYTSIGVRGKETVCLGEPRADWAPLLLPCAMLESGLHRAIVWVRFPLAPGLRLPHRGFAPGAVTQHKVPDKLIDPTCMTNMYPITRRIGALVTGVVSDARSLVQEARKKAADFRCGLPMAKAGDAMPAKLLLLLLPHSYGRTPPLDAPSTRHEQRQLAPLTHAPLQFTAVDASQHHPTRSPGSRSATRSPWTCSPSRWRRRRSTTRSTRTCAPWRGSFSSPASTTSGGRSCGRRTRRDTAWGTGEGRAEGQEGHGGLRGWHSWERGVCDGAAASWWYWPPWAATPAPLY